MSDTTNPKKSKDGIHSAQLDPVEITTQGSRTWQWKKDFYEQNPWENWRNQRLRPIFNRDLKERYERAAVNHQARKLVESTDASLDRTSRFKSLSPHERELLANSQYARLLEPTDWQSFAGGTSRMIQTAAGLPPSMHMNSRITGLSDKEFKESGPLDVLAPLDIPRKALSALMRDGYTIGDALSGVQDDSGLLEKATTDPLNLLGIGLFSKINKFKGLTQAQKWGKAAVNYGRNAVGNTALELERAARHDMGVLKLGVNEIKERSGSIKEALQNTRLPFSGATSSQKKALEDALEFNRQWYFDANGNLNPHVSKVLKEMYGMNPETINTRRYFMAENKLLGSSWRSSGKASNDPDLVDHIRSNPKGYAGIYFSKNNAAYTKYSKGLYKVPSNLVKSTAVHENAHAFQSGIEDLSDVPAWYLKSAGSLNEKMSSTSKSLRDRGLLFNFGWYDDISEFNAVQMQKRKELFDQGFTIDQIVKIEDKLKRTPLEQIERHPVGRKFLNHYGFPSNDTWHGLQHFVPTESEAVQRRGVLELMKYSPAVVPFMFSEKSKKNPPEQ